MKKVRLITLLTLTVLTLALLLLGGCQKNDNISSISLKDHDPNSVFEIAIGEFDYGSYTLVATRGSGKTEEITLTADMIPVTDQIKLYQVGEHDITISYEKCNYTFKVSVKRARFEALTLPENSVFTYDGKAHKIEVAGDIPANAVISYPGGNSFVNAGTYDVVAIVSCEGYVTEKLTATVKIERARYDMSGVKFESKDFVYDGAPHSVTVSGTIPKGVSSPKYTIDGKSTSSATNVGEYEVIASFTVNDPNYEPIPDMKAMLRITHAEYVVRGVDIVFKNEDGKTIDGLAKIYDGKKVSVALNDDSKLSKKISVAFSVYNEAGEKISGSNRETNILNAGIYTVRVDLTHSDGENYLPIAPIIRTFEVLKKDHPPLEDIRFISDQIQYDGLEHSIGIMGALPEGVSVKYEYSLGGELVVDGDGNPVKTVVNVGRYSVKAIFTHEDKNCKDIPSKSAVLIIQPIEIDVSQLGVGAEKTVEYSGASHEIQYTTWQEANEADHDVLKYTVIGYQKRVDQDLGDGEIEYSYIQMGENEKPVEIGKYRLAIIVEILDEFKENYAFRGAESDIQTIYIYLIIEKKIVSEPTVTIQSDYTTVYTGEAYEIRYTHDADPETVTVGATYFRYEDGEFVPMEDGAKPINAGRYKVIITVAVNETEHYGFANGGSSIEHSFEFEITKKVINLDELIKNAPTQYEYTGDDRRNSFTEYLSSAAVQDLTCSFDSSQRYGSDWENSDYDVYSRGYYRIRYRVEVNDKNNMELVYQGQKGATSAYPMYYFSIV